MGGPPGGPSASVPSDRRRPLDCIRPAGASATRTATPMAYAVVPRLGLRSGATTAKAAPWCLCRQSHAGSSANVALAAAGAEGSTPGVDPAEVRSAINHNPSVPPPAHPAHNNLTGLTLLVVVVMLRVAPVLAVVVAVVVAHRISHPPTPHHPPLHISTSRTSLSIHVIVRISF